MSRGPVPNSNQCIRVGIDRDHGISAVRLTLQWTAGMRKQRTFADRIVGPTIDQSGPSLGRLSWTNRFLLTSAPVDDSCGIA
jgi:hypothetical protein